MNCFTEEQLNRISDLIREIEKLSDVEKLFLYLQLPCGRAEGTEATGKSRFNGGPAKLNNNADLFSKKPDQETTQTYTWILSHLEVDPNVSLPKQEVYDEYRAFCQANRFEPLCVADFGKAMKHAFPCIKPRRLGQRGNSRYCYSGLRKKYKILPPNLPDIVEPSGAFATCADTDCSQANCNQIMRDCSDECPLKNTTNSHTNNNNNNGGHTVNRPTSFTGYEAMNLKIDPSGQHNQYPQQHHQSNGSNNNYGNPIEQRGPATKPLGGGKSAPSDASSGVQLNPITTNTSQSAGDYIPPNHNAVPNLQQQQPFGSQRSSHYYIQQPGTPDDDDYRHNYLDLLPMNGHLFCSMPLSSAQVSSVAPPPQQQPVAQCGAADQGLYQQQQSQQQQQQQQSTCTGSKDGCHQMDAIDDSVAMAQQQQQHGPQPFAPAVSGASTAAPPFPSAATPSTSSHPNLHHGHIHLTHMCSGHIDACASPFQSPTSTPYPTVMGNYMMPDLQDYYSGDCIRYPA